ncbi:hypothetical protein LZP73_00105 [Shewanella sp. AS16]|uniref:hypothetical protein n=1 Tax=Shewanella sp. AS16 TaxID=2907625 RepID=UPI001F18E859|nr:hypothetical protein [Shewanella sp. AS16]MCE9684625.1 hypothetical protein [Shewanella sp. AS16]
MADDGSDKSTKDNYVKWVKYHDLGKSSPAFTKVLVDYLWEKSTPSIYSEFLSLFSSKAKDRKRSLEEEKHTLVKELLESDIDPVAFDVLLSNEINRRLKVRFGVAFLILTLLFTAASYAIVILDGVYNWGISEIAITALVIETPIQFIGLLYIIARNLFPSAGNENGHYPKLRAESRNEDD